MRVSIVCVYNNYEQLNDCLLRGLKKQNINYELILLDGSKGKFKSCAAALNSGVANSSGDILIFSHQDIYLKSQKELENFVRFIYDASEGTIVGVAGAVEKSNRNIGNYTSGLTINEEIVERINKPTQVSCIDECFFGMTKATYEIHHFDEVLCDDWHLYAVEQCLYHRSNGDNVYVFPCQVHHLSSGKISLNYMNDLVNLADRYRKKFKYIWTTCYKVRTNYLYVRVLRIAWKFNRKIRRREL